MAIVSFVKDLFSALCCVVYVKEAHCGNIEKRFLINNGSSVNSHLQDLQSKLLDLTYKYMAQESTINELKSEVLLTKTVNGNQSRVIHDLEVKVKAQETLIRDLTTKSQTQSSTITVITLKLLRESNKNDDNALRIQWRTVWGRKTCPDNTTDLVYSGYAGGSKYSKVGGPANFLCLVPDPDLIPDVGSGQYIHGVEYDHGISGSKVGQNDLCSVCRSRTEESTLMLPGKSSCYPGWKMQYRGFLASGNEAFKSSANYICLDEHSDQWQAGDEVTLDGKLLYTVRIACGSLACPPYHNDRDATCVVYTK
ncbi:uncharacterized protein LOC134259030 [Saccostrea cucullata]|uniref:uncharacterized protein LOC134259030 n=1 Tax=Saccostrea cuccullata TaxID=36930 RepID=UPI002ED2431B